MNRPVKSSRKSRYRSAAYGSCSVFWGVVTFKLVSHNTISLPAHDENIVLLCRNRRFSLSSRNTKGVEAISPQARRLLRSQRQVVNAFATGQYCLPIRGVRCVSVRSRDTSKIHPIIEQPPAFGGLCCYPFNISLWPSALSASGIVSGGSSRMEFKPKCCRNSGVVEYRMGRPGPSARPVS